MTRILPKSKAALGVVLLLPCLKNQNSDDPCLHRSLRIELPAIAQSSRALNNQNALTGSMCNMAAALLRARLALLSCAKQGNNERGI